MKKSGMLLLMVAVLFVFSTPVLAMSTESVSPQMSSIYVTKYEYFSKFVYPNEWNIPYTQYYSEYRYPNFYSGHLYKNYCFDIGNSWSCSYAGYLYSF
ncbi:hypothetical protein [Mechercharimyces sp. CAU 1602]|uniref:hypothetical protein n=1 Tax=Mechercharimyces sp. CAU 1602 TaxID=2973933 RepID=UPI0021617E21|nr:hypothetical protein [Mechercharimyces sp. CAU 1602]MCS1350824.1 hypothetical protein [Mechercharimyces sp. CAU 1602]